MNAVLKQSVRRLIAARTAPHHEALHSHRWISSLEDPQLTSDLYLLVLGAYHAFLQDVEDARLRLNAFPQLSLQDPIANLTADLVQMPYQDQGVILRHGRRIRDTTTLLANLYVIHGAGFGAATLNAKVKKSLPNVSRHYLGKGTSADLWRYLVSDLERLATRQNDLKILISEAIVAFDTFGQFVSVFCETNSQSKQLAG